MVRPFLVKFFQLPKFKTLALIVSALCCANVQADLGNFKIEAGIENSLTYRNQSSGLFTDLPKSFVFWRAAPYIKFSGKRSDRRIDAKLGLDHVHNFESENSLTLPLASVNSKITIVDQQLWLDIAANLAKNKASLFDQISQDFENGPEIAENYLDFSLSETGFKQINKSTLIAGAHKFSVSDSKQDNYERSQTHSLDLRAVKYIESYSRYFYTDFGFQQTHVENSGTYKSRESLFGVGINSHGNSLKTEIAVGWNLNNFPNNQLDSNHSFWQIGADWKPTPMVLVEARLAERYFGSAPLIRATYSGRKNSLSLEWIRKSSFRRYNILGNQNNGSVTASSSVNSGSSTSGEVAASPSNEELNAIDEQVTIQHRLTGRISTLTSILGYRDRELTQHSGNSNSIVSFASLEFSRNFSKALEISIVGIVEETKTGSESENLSAKTLQISTLWRF